MKRFSLIFCLLLFSFLTKAQFSQFAEGPVFPDPGEGVAKILQLKNNSTMFIHVSFVKGLNVHVYDAANKVKTETNIEPAYGALKAGNVEGIFEINGDAVVLISESGKTETLLYRLIIDGKTAKLKEEKQIAAVKRASAKKGISRANAALLSDLAVRKDPASENYAVALFNGFESDTSRRVEIILYGNDNKEINRGYYSAAEEKYKYLQYLDMVVIGNEKVALLLYGFNIGSSNEKTGELVLATLDKGTKTVGMTDLNFSNDLLVDNGITRYDPQTKRMLFISNATIKSESGKAASYLAFIDPFSKNLISNTAIKAGENVQNKYAELYGRRAVYAGIPQNLLLNNDGSFTVIYEEMETERAKDTVTYSALRNTAIVTYNNDLEITNSYLVPLDQYVSALAVPVFYQSGRDAAGQQCLYNNQYKSSTYISDGHNSFLVFNDKGINAQTAGSGTVSPFKDLADADAFYCQLTGTEITPKRQYVFGKPVNASGAVDHKLGLFTVYDYDKANNIFVVLKQDKEPGHPGVKLVWLQP